MSFQQTTEIEDRGFIGNPIQIQPRELAQNRRFIQELFHRRIAVAEPVLHQMNPQHGHQRIRRTAPFALWIMRFDQSKQALPRLYLTHLDQEALAAGLLTFASIFGLVSRFYQGE